MTADPFHWEPRKPLKGLRIGVLAKAFENFRDEDKKVYDQALADLRKAGVAMTPVELSDDNGGKPAVFAFRRSGGGVRRYYARRASEPTERASLTSGRILSGRRASFPRLSIFAHSGRGLCCAKRRRSSSPIRT